MTTRGICALLVAGLAAAACGPASDSAGQSRGGGPEETVLGPEDGHDLPPTDLDRVRAGDMAPDFSLVSLAGPVLTLSDYRGETNVVLVFYRGHW